MPASTTFSLETRRSSTEALNQIPIAMPKASSRKPQVRAHSFTPCLPCG